MKDPSATSVSQTIHTVVLAPLLKIHVDFAKRRVKVTQNGDPLSSASATAGADQLTLEVRPMCSVPVRGAGPRGDG
jgi:hypothetical protein